MRLDTANRSFYSLVGVVAVPYVALMTLGCGLSTYVVWHVWTNGMSTLTGPRWDLRLALLFLTVVGAATVASLWSLRRQWCSTRVLEHHVRVRSVALPPAVDVVAGRIGLAGCVDVVDEDDPCCFTYGLRAPRVAISTALVDRISSDELGAVLAHERYHVRHNDPFKLIVTRAFTRAFFFLPVLRFLHHRYLAARELAADRRAVRQCGRGPLAGALVKAVGGPEWSDVGVAAAIGGSDHLELRVEQLERGQEPALPPLPRTALWGTGLAMAALMAALTAAVWTAGGPAALMDRSSSSMPMSSWPTLLAVAACAAGWVLAAWLLVRWGRRAGLHARPRGDRGSGARGIDR